LEIRFDDRLAQNGIEMVRYADDFILLCRSEQEAQEALEQVQRCKVLPKIFLVMAGRIAQPRPGRIQHRCPNVGFPIILKAWKSISRQSRKRGSRRSPPAPAPTVNSELICE
jgi:hypothetical protein